MKKKRKRRTIFGKYLALSLSTVLVGFTLIGVMLTFFVTQYSQSEKQTLLAENASSVADMVSQNCSVVGNKIYLTIPEYNRWQSVIATMSKSLSAEIFITDSSGNTQICSDNNNCVHINKKIDGNIMAVALNRDYVENGKLGGIYSEPHFTVGTPIIITEDSGKVAVGAVFISTRSSSMFYVVGEIVRIFLMAAIATFAIMFCLSGFFTYNMAKPLRQMAIAAKKFGAGDFSSRVPITTNDEIGQLAEEFNNMAD